MLCRIVVSNLLKNAIEASPQNASVSIEVLDAPLQEIRVRNQGEVALEIRERLFDKYVTSGKKHGTGLGAYSARIMARAMGGDLELDCSVPGSTSLRFKLPKPS